jgi:hypothetical protein
MESRAEKAGAFAMVPGSGERSRTAQLLALCLVAGSLALVGLGALGAANPGGFVWIDRLLHHTFAFGVVAALGFSVGCALLVGWHWLRVVMIVLGAGLAGIWLLAGLYAWTMFHEPEIESVSAPEGTGSSYELVVRESSDDILDPAWVLSIRQTGSLLAREWYLGCMSGDAAGTGFKSARWRDPSHLLVRAQGGRTRTVTVDPINGEPVASDPDLWTCQRP